jgi:crotonobetainyl-CoA:carnitine CoA-transferase CaiB-like acyl-CoA transferase
MNLAEVCADPQVVSQEMVLAIPHPGHGTVKMTGFPLKFREAPLAVRYAAPDLGTHTAVVLRALGYSDVDIANQFSVPL